MIDPVSAGALKVAIGAVPATIRAVAQELARRDTDTRAFATLEPIMNEALDVLTAELAPSPGALLSRAKAVLSDVPAIFRQPEVCAWIGQGVTRDAVKAAVMALVQTRDETAATAKISQAATIEDQLRPAAAVAFDQAVAFVARSLDRGMDVGDRVVSAKIDGLRLQLAEVAQAATQAVTGLQLELLNREAENAVERMRKRRFFHDADRLGEATELAVRLATGNLKSASDAVRARGLAICARVLALGETADTARSCLKLAVELGGGEEAAVAKAFLASNESEAAALSALAPIGTDMRREAALVMVKVARGAMEALAWAAQAGIDAANLTPDGRQFLLHYALEADEWSTAYDLALGLASGDAEQSPALFHHAALARLGSAVPADQRFLVRNGPPFDAASFSLSDEPKALDDRRAAAALFEQGAAATRALGAPKASAILTAYALWLRLRDPETTAAARIELAAVLEDDERGLVAIPLAIGFGLPLDRERLSRELDRRDALDPEGSPEAAMARFALLNIASTPDAGLAELRRLKARIGMYITPLALLNLEVGLLVALERHAEATALLDASAEVIDAVHLQRLRAGLGPEADGPSLEDLEGWYASEPSTLNLHRLVDRLAQGPYTPRFFELSRRLVAATRAGADAEALVERLVGMDRHDEAAQLLSDVEDLIPASLSLRGAKAWSDYRHGRMADAWAQLTDLRKIREDRNDKALFANILIASGRWPELLGHVESEWERRHDRDAQQLIELASLAAELGSPRVMEFVALAAAAAPDDANIQLACYSISVRAGLEDENDAWAWLQRAIALSDENGPVTPGNLEDLVSRSGDWRQRTDEVWRKLRDAELPLFVGAKLLHQSGLELQLVPLITNPNERDPRRRIIVPAFSGARGEVSARTKTIALDGSAVVTLGVLNQLDAVVKRPGGVVLPHALFGWLFAERQKLRFHQPSRIRQARDLVQAVPANRLRIFATAASAPPALMEEVGQDLADMLESARTAPGDSVQHLVVRSAPVTRIGSFAGEVVPLAEFAPQLVSCAQLIDKLVSRGHLTQAEADQGHAYLQQHNEQRWPNEPEIADDAVLYLDDLSVSYLRSVGVLYRLHAAGLTAMVAAREINEANALLEMEARAKEIEDAIERIRKPLADGIASGAVTLAPMVDGDELTSHPNLAIARAAALVDAIVSDDRYVNKTRGIADHGHHAEIWTSLEVLEDLRRGGHLSEAEVGRARYDLRRGGAIFVAPTPEELVRLIEQARAKDGILLETAELRAIRENLELAQMRGWLYLPSESAWLDRLQGAAIQALLAQWSDGVADDIARARSSWLLQRADIRNWARADGDADPTGLSTCGLVLALNRLLLALPELSDEGGRDRLTVWLQDSVIVPLQSEDSDAYDWMLGHLRALILGAAAADIEASDGE